MKTIFYSLTFLLTSWLATDAQKVTMQFGQAVPLPGNAYYQHLIYADAQYSYVFYPDDRASRSDAPSLAKIDKAGNVVYTKKIVLDNKKTYDVTILAVNRKLYILYKADNQINYQQLDENAAPGEKKVLLDNVPPDKIEFIQSADQTKLAVSIGIKPEVGNGRVAGSLLATKADDLELHVFDGDLKETGKGFVRKHNPDEVQEHSFTLTNDGNLYVASHFIGSKAKKVFLTGAADELYDYSISNFVVTRISSSGQRDVTPFKAGDKSLVAMHVFTGDNNEAYVAGYYGNLAKALVSGMFSSRFDADENKFNALAYQELDDKTLKVLSLSGGKLSLINGVVTADGAYVISETVDKSSSSTVEVRGTMLVSIINTDGTINKLVPVTKYQEQDDVRDEYCSFIAFKSGNSACLLFTDNGDNSGDENKKPKKEHSWPESPVVVARINNQGAITREVLNYNKDLGAIFEPATCIVTSGDGQHSLTVQGAQLKSTLSKYKYYVGRISF